MILDAFLGGVLSFLPLLVFSIVVYILVLVVSLKLKARKSTVSDGVLISHLKSAARAKANGLDESLLPDPCYVPTGFLFTPTEIRFLNVLESIAGDRINVYGKVRIADLLQPDVDKWEKGSGWYNMFSQISQKHVDYVLTDDNYNVLCAIELNDSSHDKPDRIKRDDFVDGAFKSAGLPLLWIKAESEYLEEEISKLIAEIITSASID